MGDLADAVKEWLATKSNVDSLKERVREMSKRESALKGMVKRMMIDKSIDVINLKDGGKVLVSKKTSKGSVSAKTVKDGLETFFDGDTSQVEMALQSIQAHRQEKPVVSISYRKPKSRDGEQ